MSHNSSPVTDGIVAASPHANGSYSSCEEPELTQEGKTALVTRAKDVIAGRTPPPPFLVPVEVEEFVQKEITRFPAMPTPEAIRHIREQLSLQAVYKGIPVASYTMPDGSLSVLGAGEQEIRTLLEGLSEDEEVKILIMDTMYASLEQH